MSSTLSTKPPTQPHAVSHHYLCPSLAHSVFPPALPRVQTQICPRLGRAPGPSKRKPPNKLIRHYHLPETSALRILTVEFQCLEKRGTSYLSMAICALKILFPGDA